MLTQGNLVVNQDINPPGENLPAMTLNNDIDKDRIHLLGFKSSYKH